MSAKFITGVLTVAATIATLSAVPARAGEGETAAKIVAGVVGVYIAGQLINEFAENGARADVTRVHGSQWGHHGRHDGRRDWKKPRHRRALPAHCIRKIQKRHTRFVMPQFCLRQNNVAVRHLPKRCRIHWEGRRGAYRTGYAVRCMKRHGYSFARWW